MDECRICSYCTRGGGPKVVVSTAAFHARAWGSVTGLGGFKETKMFLPHPRVKVSIVGSLHDREVACSASDRQGSNFKSCVWRTVSSQSSHHPQEVLRAQFSLYVHKSGLKPNSFHFISHCTQMHGNRFDILKGENKVNNSGIREPHNASRQSHHKLYVGNLSQFPRYYHIHLYV